jgi:hypothetical protein
MTATSQAPHATPCSSPLQQPHSARLSPPTRRTEVKWSIKSHFGPAAATYHDPTPVRSEPIGIIACIPGDRLSQLSSPSCQPGKPLGSQADPHATSVSDPEVRALYARSCPPETGRASALVAERARAAQSRSRVEWTTRNSYEPAAGCDRRFRFEPPDQEPTSGSRS